MHVNINILSIEQAIAVFDIACESLQFLLMSRSEESNTRSPIITCHPICRHPKLHYS